VRVGTVASLAEHRAARAARVAARKGQHPALRWVAGRTYYVAHRRDPVAGAAACGATGELVLAPPGVPLCRDCYPVAASE
jgi:hypothetical protein